MAYHNSSNLRLEIEVPHEGLNNLVQNPSGQLGGWGWITPTAGGVIFAPGTGFFAPRIQYNGDAGASYFHTELMPVTVGEYVGGRYNCPTSTGFYHRVRVEWYDSDRLFVSSATQSALRSGTGDFYIDDVVVPASVAYATVRFDIYVSGGGNPTTGNTFYVKEVMLGMSDTASDFDEPYEYVEPVNWLNIYGESTEISISRKEMDVGLLEATVVDPDLDPSVEPEVRPGKRVRVSAQKYGQWQNLYYGKLTNAEVTYDKTNGKLVTNIHLTASDAVSTLANQGASSGIKGIDDLPYILEGKGVAWNVNGSGSQVSSADVVAYNDNASVLDQVAVTRDSNLGYAWIDKDNVLNVFDSSVVSSTVEATFTDTAVVNLLPNGDFEDTDLSMWDHKVGDDTEIDFSRDTTTSHSGTASMKIETLTAPAVGPWSGIETDEFACSTYTKHTVSFWIKASSDGLDAFVGIYGSGSAYDDIYLNSTVTTQWQPVSLDFITETDSTFHIEILSGQGNTTGDVLWIDDLEVKETAASYSDIDVDFNVDSAINHVTVKWLRYDIGYGSTEEVSYGPYVDQSSIDTWGARSATFTIQGDAADETEGNISAFADDILTANATPVVRANSLSMPVRNQLEMGIATDLDLYDLVGVEFDTKVDTTYRITGLTHNITPETWTVDVVFGVDGSVAAPTWIPSPPFNGVSSEPYSARYRNNNLSTSTGWTTINFGTVEAEEGISYDGSGTWTIDKAGKYLVTAGLCVDRETTNRREIAVVKNSSIVVRKALPATALDADNAVIDATAVLTCNEGDTINIDFYQNSGGSLSLIGGAELTRVEIVWLRP